MEENEDPLGRLGYGVMSYFNLITTFLVIFFLLACAHIPMMYEYHSWLDLDGDSDTPFLASLSIGNLGMSMPFCLTMKMVGEQVPLDCDTGLIAEVNHVGVLGFGSEADSKGLCASGVTQDDTGNDCEDLFTDNELVRQL